MSTTFKHLALTALNCFGAGVILTTCFTHMLPEANEALEESSIKNQGYVSNSDPLIFILRNSKFPFYPICILLPGKSNITTS